MNARSVRRLAAATAVTTALTAITACSSDDDPAPPAGNGGTVAGVRIEKDAALHDALPAEIKEAGTVKVATDVPYPPFEMYVEEGKSELTGLDYDLAQALGAKLGVRFVFSPQKFDGIVPAIQAGKFHAAMSAITDNKERQQVVDFVDYSRSGSGILVAEGNPEGIATLDDLCGERIAVQVATNQLDLLKEHQARCEEAGDGRIDIQTFPKDSDAQLALRSGKVVAQLLTKPAAGWTAKTADDGKTFDLVEDPAAPGGYKASPNGIAVTKKLPDLTDAIQKALQALIDDGTVTKIFEKYGVASIAVKEATRNAAVD
ncbi:ABC transporter substrate-binding protein [Streptomyces pilosus]|uniref:ABC transporter substrate-binding protein n=1 Tax=Streptomyces pilosus TaxID=28893 RepID=A0A918EV89_9ACTN|nr:ABC transporter substrate-binding protein [Streptomyces pilosus]GGQ70373.1 ABC transporter substrate-binding protein [Streptomyces pilosus]GGV55181.1 ABC transporter substrate-binding protein [Streptomyces pilosus]